MANSIADMAGIAAEGLAGLGEAALAGDVRQEVITATTDRILHRHMLALKDEKPALAATLREIGGILFGPNGRAMKHIDHFINGGGREVDVPLDRLLAEDGTVRERVVNETYRRVLGVNTVREKLMLREQAAGRVNLIHPSGIDPVITIFQSNFSNTDWWGALGTYAVRIDPFAAALSTRNSSGIGVILTGSNLYTWHPKDDRPSKRVHEIAARLEQLGGAKSFPMRSAAHTMIVDKSRAGILHWITLQQTNPRGNRPLTREQVVKLLSKWL